MPKLKLNARQELRAAPALLTHARLLELTTVGLHQAIAQELEANPALEELALPAAPRGAGRADDAERLMRVAAPVSLADALLGDLRASLPAADHALAALVVGSLDERGLLEEAPQSLARAAGVARGRIEAVLAALRELGPPGIAARDPRACLLAQLDAMPRGEAPPLARSIVAAHLDDLAAGRQRAIARALGAAPEEVEAARAFIAGRLWPYPLQAALGGPAEPDRRAYRAPDLIFRRAGDSFSAEPAAAPGRALQLSPVYAELAERAATLPADEAEHVRSYVERARVFLRSLRRRGETLARVGAALAERQAPFLREGPRALAPLTRLQLAHELRLHESTVCRAVADKTALLPDGALWPLDGFFDAARPAREVLRELIAAEAAPLSDQQLAAMLAERGHPVARRTVAKYRDELGIPPQHQRARRGP
ncbi:MAG TPA: hypothetical protein PKD53_06160 [Chloroflexaceae bacterium]|nr:hypothetical protein [Chloroflexaceae bacterium]